MPYTQMIEELSQHFWAWEHLSEAQRASVMENSRLVAFNKGENVHNAESDCLGVMLIKSGSMRVYMLSEEGREITLYRLAHGDMCILSASCVLPVVTFDVRIDAEEDSQAIVISSACFARLTHENIYAECFAYKLATERFSDVMWTVQQILFMSMDRRLAVFLLDELAKAGGDSLRMTHEQMARYMGSAREVVTRMLNYFASERIVELSRGEIRLLDRPRLRDLASGYSK